MYFKKHVIPRLQDYVEFIWELKLPKNELGDGYHMIPDNYGELMINLGCTISSRVSGMKKAQVINRGEAYLGNCRSRGVVFESENDLHLLSAKIKPGFVNLLLRKHDTTYRDKFSLISREFQLPADPYIEPSIFRLSDLIIDRINDNKMYIDPLIAEAILMIEERQGRIMIKEIYEGLAVSKSTLEQKFLRELTITPKEYCKIEKMKGFMMNYNQHHHDYNLTQLTFQSGYYDQSHFIKDFRYFMDMSPRTFFSRRAIMSY